MTTAKFADGGVSTADFAEGAVTSVKIADRSITGLHIARGQTITSDHLAEGAVNGDTILDASVGEVDLDIKLVADFDVIARTGKLTAEGVLEVAKGFADVGILTSASGKTIATLSIGDKLRIKRIIEDFQDTRCGGDEGVKSLLGSLRESPATSAVCTGRKRTRAAGDR